MAIVVDISSSVRGCKDEDKDNNHDGWAVDLTFDDRAHQIQSIPIHNYISDYHSDYSIEGSRSSSLNSLILDYYAKYVSSYSRENIDDESSQWPQRILYSREEEEGHQDVTKDVEEVNMQEYGRK